jgi:RNA polymerase sigma-70 factor (ECF subfamily)
VSSEGNGKPTAAERAAKARALVADAKQAASTVEERRAKERARDVALVDLARSGDSQAFQKLVVAHQARLFSVAYGMLRDRDDAMDVVQDAFIKAHRKLPEFEGNAAFSTWLYRIAVNLCIDRKRADARRRKTDLDDAATRNLDDDPLYAEAEYAPRMSGANPLRNVGDRELGAQLGKAMAQLSEDHRAIVLLREVEGMSYEEIAVTLGVPKGTVMSRLFHARKNLQRLLRPTLGIAEGMGPSGRPLEEGRPQKTPQEATAAPDPESDTGREETAPAERRSRKTPAPASASGGE